MNKLRFIRVLLTTVSLGVLFLVIGAYVVACQANPEPITAPLQTPPLTPAEQNFEQGKIWTESDFELVELDHDQVDYLEPCDKITGDCYNITEEDVRLITEHNQKRLEKFTASTTKSKE